MNDLPTVFRSQLVPSRDASPRDATSYAELLEDFQNQTNDNTRAAYKHDLERFRVWLAVADLRAATEWLLGYGSGDANKLALRWKNHMLADEENTKTGKLGLAPATINRRLTALRSLVGYFKVCGVIEWQLSVKNVKRKALRDTKGPGLVGFKKLLAALDAKALNVRPGVRPMDAKIYRRNRAILRLLFSMALRRHEVCQLDLSDVNQEQGLLQIRGKGQKETQFVTMPPGVAGEIDKWITCRSLDGLGDDVTALFVNYDSSGKEGKRKKAGEESEKDKRKRKKNKGRLGLRSITRLVTELGGSAEVKASPHRLRHAAITTSLIRNNGNIVASQAFARHSSPATTGIYFDNLEDAGGKTAQQVDDMLDEKDGTRVE